VVPSPKVQRYEKDGTPPTVVAVKVTVLPTSGVAGLEVKSTDRAAAGIVTGMMMDLVPLHAVAEQIPVTVTLYLPPGVEAVVETVNRSVNEVTLVVSDPLAVTSVAVGPLVTTGLTAGDRKTVPTPLRKLLTVTVDVADMPAVIVREEGLAERTKLLTLITVAVAAVSGVGVVPPFVIVIHRPVTLDPAPQVPVRNVTGVPAELAAIL
jgi:hypothetical protein